MMLSGRSIRCLIGVHPDLVRVVRRAAEALVEPSFGFVVLEGLRSYDRQVQLVAAGASQTLNSRHLTGHAVDLGAVVGDELRWDWPLYDRLAGLMEAAAKAEGVAIVWGGHWTSLRDGPHYELDRAVYPAPTGTGSSGPFMA